MYYYALGTGRHCCICTRQMWHVHSPDGSTFLCEITPWSPPWTFDVISKLGLCKSMLINLKNNRAKFHPDLIWNDGALGLFYSNNKKNHNKMSSDVICRTITCQYLEQTINTVRWLYVQQCNIWAFRHRICFDSSSKICCWPCNGKWQIQKHKLISSW